MEKNKDGQNSLQIAALNRKFDSVEYLVAHRFPLHGKDRLGSGILHSAVRGGSVSIVDYLHRQGLSYLDQDLDGNNALHLAAKYGRARIA
jgi:ankyrin repeat protein